MALLAPDDRVLVLRREIGLDGPSWVEEVDPESLEVRRRSPDLPVGPFWPGGAAVLADGAVVVVQGRWAHRLTPDLDVEATRQLPVDAPYNSFVVLDDGSLATKDLQRPGAVASTLSILDPVTLEDRCAPTSLPEAAVARLSADGDVVVVVGVTGLHSVRWDPAAGRLDDPVRVVDYLSDGDHSFGWDPVVDAGATWWIDNGDHRFENGFTMLGNGVSPGPCRLWRARSDGRTDAVEVSGSPGGAVTNPPIVDPARGLVVAYDSANGVLAAFDVESLENRWRRPLGVAQHLVAHPDTGELVVNDHRPESGDAVAVVDIESGEVTARVDVESPAQSVVFGAPGRNRDHYYVSLSTIARIVFTD